MTRTQKILRIPWVVFAGGVIGFLQWLPRLLGLRRWNNAQDRDEMADAWGYDKPALDEDWRRYEAAAWYDLHNGAKQMLTSRIKNDVESGAKTSVMIAFLEGAASVGLIVLVVEVAQWLIAWVIAWL